ncbi:MAG: DUF1385 domain-containing protein [Lachnospiraceae bacterium]|nr:DUF1385 domain-containing protein [Lachnospiraceae bacterium]
MGKRRKKQFSGLTEKPIFEGVLIKNQNKYSLEVRKSDGEIQTVVKNAEANPDKLIKKIPFVRGIFVLLQNILLVLEALEFSADFFGNDTGKETFWDKIMVRLFGKHTNVIVTAVTASISFIVGFGFITMVPFLLSHYLENYIVNKSVISIIEFALYVIILFGFVCSFMLYKEVRRVMKYHAAAHKCINCIERGRKLNYKNVAASSIFFARCTTGYIIVCVFISAILFALVKIESFHLRVLFRLLYIPLATGLFYEFYLLICHLPDGILYKILTAPNFIFQVFFLLRPDDEMIATAMAGLDAVFDWKEFLVISFPNKYASSDFGLDKKDAAASVDKLIVTEEEVEKEFAKINESMLDDAISHEESEEYNGYDRFSNRKSDRYIEEEGYGEGYVNYASDENLNEDYYSDETEGYYEEGSYEEGSYEDDSRYYREDKFAGRTAAESEEYYERYPDDSKHYGKEAPYAKEELYENEVLYAEEDDELARIIEELDEEFDGLTGETYKESEALNDKASASLKENEEVTGESEVGESKASDKEVETVAEESKTADEEAETVAEESKAADKEAETVTEEPEVSDKESKKDLEEIRKAKKAKKAKEKAKAAEREAKVAEREAKAIIEESAALADNKEGMEETKASDVKAEKTEAESKVSDVKTEKAEAETKAEEVKTEKTEAEIKAEEVKTEKTEAEIKASDVKTEKAVEGSKTSDTKAEKADEEEKVVAQMAGDYNNKYIEDSEEDEKESVAIEINVAGEVEKLTRTQPISIDFMDDYGFDPEDEEVPENQMVFEPVDESTADLSHLREEFEEEEAEGNVPLFSKEIESIPMPESLDNIVEYLPEGGVMSRIYNLNTDEADRNEFYDDDEEEDFDNIIDENGHLTLKDTDAFNRKLDEEFDEVFKRLGLNTDDL